MFNVMPVVPEPMVTLSTVPLTRVVTAVPPATPLTWAVRLYVPAGRCAARGLAVPGEVREARRLRAEIDRLHQHARTVGDVEDHLGAGLRHAHRSRNRLRRPSRRVAVALGTRA